MLGSKASSYIMFNTSQDLNSAYLKYLQDAGAMMLNPAFGLSAIIYTELTDVENEVWKPIASFRFLHLSMMKRIFQRLIIRDLGSENLILCKNCKTAVADSEGTGLQESLNFL